MANDTTPNTGPIIIFDHGGLMFPLNNTSFSTELPLTEESTLTMETLTTKPIIMKLDSSGRSWTSAIESCDLMKFDFCIRGDSHSCLEELPSHYNLAELPTEFTAWVRSFQLYAYSALFISKSKPVSTKSRNGFTIHFHLTSDDIWSRQVSFITYLM